MEPTKTQAAPVPFRVIRRKTGFAALDLGQIWEYRDLLTTLAARDVQLRYRQTALGALWVVIQPLMSAAIFTFLFNKVAGFSSHGVPPLLFTFGGMLVWSAFSGFVSKSSGIIVSSMNLVTKVYFPRLILPVTPILSTLIDFGVGFLVLLVMMAFQGYPLHATMLAIPIVLAGTLSLALGLSLFASAMQVKYRDVQYVVPVFVNMLLFISPTGYALSEIGKKVPASVQGIYTLNPLVGLLELGRWSLLGTSFPSLGLALYSLGASIAILLLGMFYFKSQERGFADVI